MISLLGYDPSPPAATIGAQLAAKTTSSWLEPESGRRIPQLGQVSRQQMRKRNLDPSATQLVQLAVFIETTLADN
jgi:hypothetical protein